MARIQELEKYFDVLSREDSGYSSEHDLAEDSKRFELYTTLKEKLQKVSKGLNHVSGLLTKDYKNYISLIGQLGFSFDKFSKMDNSDLDYCIRTIVVDSLVSDKDYEKNVTSGDQALVCLIEEMVGLFFEDGDEMVKITTEAMEELKNKKSASFFGKKNDEELKKYIMYILGMYGNIEMDLIDAKSGIIAKDKKMIETLRQLRLGVGKAVIEIAMQKTSLVSKKAPLSQTMSKLLDRSDDSAKGPKSK